MNSDKQIPSLDSILSLTALRDSIAVNLIFLPTFEIKSITFLLRYQLPLCRILLVSASKGDHKEESKENYVILGNKNHTQRAVSKSEGQTERRNI